MVNNVGTVPSKKELKSLTNTSTSNIKTAVLLAAGTGNRLQPLTLNTPKCLVEVGGIPILGRLVDHLCAQGFERLVVVLGHMGERIEEFLSQHAGHLQVEYVVNPIYQTTNNIYSLWLARELIHEPFLLVESDLVFETWMLDGLLQPDRMAISPILPWMNGTTVELGVKGNNVQVSTFRMGGYHCDDVRQYKTVNLYSLSLESWKKIESRLSDYVSEQQLGGYYEGVFAELVSEGEISFDTVLFDADKWYEIDTLEDLKEAGKLFELEDVIIGNTPVIPPAEIVLA